ncbi:MAG: hypothetical protein HOC70_02465 [Gammaproteobacteria bacterium]|jgi:regulator of sirC expression with transglutaminase-like and TPR domain|nr:hypothetical protein [Gammaproteobacteria bacterium]MBT4492077.1 hypothetical protein [Gammaproteobacteria bacterium]MBT7371662.1 hypothetical protein [Gammaproteobacteria bacterium]
MAVDIRQRFAEIVAQPDEAIPLDEAALLIAAEAEPDIVIDDYLSQLKNFAIDFQRQRQGYGIPVTSLVNYIHEDLGFSGNVSDYYDPRNSYLNRVVDSRCGIPISLALIHISIGGRLDIPVSGISFPGHFLVRYGKEPGAIVDPFSGRELSHADCQNLLRQIAGPRATLKEEYFDSASTRDVLIRILDNLKQIFWRAKEWDESKACIDRQLLLLPDREEFNVQLGAVYEMQGNTAMAHLAYNQVLQAATDEKLRQLASKRLLALADGPRTIH